MSIQQAFLTNIIENPQDDSVRRIYADWLINNEREKEGEFILKQIATGEREYREIFMLGEQYHLKSIDVTYHRGFIIEVTGELQALMNHLPYLAGKHPIQSIRATDKQPTQLHSYYEWYLSSSTYYLASQYFLPVELELHLQQGERIQYWWRYYSEAAAMNDLSRALIRWARQ